MTFGASGVVDGGCQAAKPKSQFDPVSRTFTLFLDRIHPDWVVETFAKEVVRHLGRKKGECLFGDGLADLLRLSPLDSGRVCRIPPNMLGRDFVVGDIHGAFDAVIAGMRAVNFDRARDRILSVGDLCDRGAGSARLLGFLQQPYVHAIRGNHDHDLSEVDFRGARILAEMDFNGMGWLKAVSEAEFVQIQGALSALPIVMEVETPRGLVGLVHGDVPAGMSWPEFVAFVEAGEPEVLQTALTGRRRLRAQDDSGIQGIGRLFVGHTVQWDGLQRFGNVYAIDTGAVFREIRADDRGHLSFVNIEARTGVLVSACESSSSVKVFDDSVPGVFGAYCAQTP